MYLTKKLIAISLTISLSLFFCLSAYANQSDLYAKSSIRKSNPVSRGKEADIPKEPEPTFWDKYKWWIALGVVAIGGGAAAAGGGGGDDSTSAPDQTGNATVTW